MILSLSLRAWFTTFLILLASSLTACVPHLMEKYRQKNPAQELVTTSAKDGARPNVKKVPGRPPAIFMVDPGTVRILASYDKVWEAMLEVLLKNYNLAIADRANGLITTEWDTYYLDSKLHRNKLSFHIKKVTSQGVELMIYNNVETLSRMPDGLAELWLPTDRSKPEVGRVIQNMSIALNLPKPDLPSDMMASQTPAADGAAAVKM